MQKGFYKYYKDLPPYVKGAVIIGIGAVLFIVGKKLFFPSESEKAKRQLLKSVDQEIANFFRQGMKPTYSDSQYSQFANQIYEGMRYIAGDDYTLVENTLKRMQNNLDVAKLIKAFGSRQDYALGIPTGEPKDLFTYVQSELGNEYGGLTGYRVTRINEDWKKKGITYKI